MHFSDNNTHYGTIKKIITNKSGNEVGFIVPDEPGIPELYFRAQFCLDFKPKAGDKVAFLLTATHLFPVDNENNKPLD